MSRSSTRLLLCLPMIAVTAVADAPRSRETLAGAWRFQLGDMQAAHERDFNDADWDTVTVPHTWNARDGQDGGNDYHRGPAWYRTTFTIPPDKRLRRHFLRFNAASIVADVYLDGRHVGQHRGAFAAFCFEITPWVRPGSSYTLAVRVDNSKFEDVPPLSGDFTKFGGIYRPVELLSTAAVCISPLDYASPGVYLTTKKVTDEQATIEVRTLLSSVREGDTNLRIRTTLRDAEGESVVADTQPLSIPGGANAQVTQSLIVKEPHRWDGVRDPYLYAARVELLRGTHVVDRVEQPLGIRTFRLDADTGFHLNSERLDLHGVCRHQDRKDKGWAISRADQEEDFRIIAELGAHAVRLAHYQHADYAYTLADRYGFVVWAEIPLIDVITDSDAFRENCAQQLRELIRQNYNHPSICFWGIHNEITAPWRPGPDPTALVRQLDKLAREEDPRRLTVSAATVPDEHPANWVVQGVAFNRYFGWYDGQPDDFAPWADRWHRKRPDQPIGISEFGAGASIHDQEAWPLSRPVHDSQYHPEQWQSYLHERHWRAMKKRSWLWCKLVWNAFDFASDGRSEGDTPGRNDKGLVTYDRSLRKDAYYWYQANWSSEPMVHIAGRRYSPRPEDLTTISVYTNCDRVTLWINDARIGTSRAPECVARWKDVSLRPGSNVIRVEGVRGGKKVRDRCRLAGTAGE